MSDIRQTWTVVVPVKGTAAGKTRMAPGLDQRQRMLLVEAFALDAVSALSASALVDRVIVVTDAAAELSGSLRALGADIVADPGAGLNAAVAAGIEAARATRAARAEAVDGRAAATSGVDAGVAVAALLGDLPCLVTADVDDALTRASAHPLAVVPDAEGGGTTLITALPGIALVPRFGVGSAARHAAAGHVVLDVPPASTLRLDVDTEEDLAAALSRGVGPHTRAVWA
ncbi:2-phospho-L-lactate guanylyltransferase [Herbiconiux ginsengi]|uniref:Phosphoenolpyruvate guanylyltransferase n=1 Tax=Herbiconiux ginsengi TaxID=381665 RepID=A0A1H3S797_9MICO|nr:2-phospho-L-lactate guanylyltransferase [Herbiconiux ginsengi]SDZ33832.1 2-phospho-L-lactate guanylyltransferase [Herbiconiux ginsengi]